MTTTEQDLVVSVERAITATPEQVFAVLSDPHRHPELDGSGTVRRVRSSSGPLQVGSEFDMHMRRGFSYSTRNTVLELEPNRAIAWSTRPLTFPLSLLIGGRTWRYVLTPDDDVTRVSETWDLREERNRAVVRRLAGDPRADMERTLERLQELVR